MIEVSLYKFSSYTTNPKLFPCILHVMKVLTEGKSGPPYKQRERKLSDPSFKKPST
jgi:hypothetical protein